MFLGLRKTHPSLKAGPSRLRFPRAPSVPPYGPSAQLPPGRQRSAQLAQGGLGVCASGALPDRHQASACGPGALCNLRQLCGQS